MRQFFTRFILLLLTFKPALGVEDIDKNVNAIFTKNSSLADKLNFSISVYDLNTKKEIYSLNLNKSQVPASVTKSFTAFAALKFLKPDFKFVTQILFDKSKINSKNILDDNLYIKFSGDPTLTTNDLKALITSIKDYNISIINKDLVIDDSIFDREYQAPGWAWDDNKFCFASPTSAIVIDKNCFQMNLSPDKASGKIAKLQQIKKHHANINNQIITKKNKNCTPELTAFYQNEYHLTNCLDIDSPEIPLNIAYQNPLLMIEAKLIDLLKESNIKLKGKIRFATAPENLSGIIEHKSAPLSLLINNMMKDSDNTTADVIVKTIGHKYYHTQGNFKNGIQALKEILTQNTGYDFNKLPITDGSGGSRYNLISANELVTLYKAAYSDPAFYHSLPIYGIDGTLKTFNNENLLGKIHAKTGSMRNIFSLAGYIENENSGPLVFSILINGPASRTELKNLIDELLEVFIKK